MFLNCGVGEDSWESLDCKEIQPIHPKGKQCLMFTGRTDVEAETPILWPPDVKSWLIWKDPYAGKDWGQKDKGMTEMAERRRTRDHFLQIFSSVQFSCSVVSDSLQPHVPAACQASLSITNSQSPPKPMSIELVMPCNHLILCHPLLFLPSIFPSIRGFSNESALLKRWPKYWSLSFSIVFPALNFKLALFLLSFRTGRNT